MADWRLARSLIILREEINRAAPARSKISDGTKGDAAHAGRASRHNPNDAGVVCAMDITNDPAHGMDVHALAERLIGLARTGRTNPDFEYVVSNSRIASRTSGWAWRPYHGINPHEHHVHFAVGRGPDSEPVPPYDDLNSWGVTSTPPPPQPTPPVEEDEMKAMLYTGATGSPFAGGIYVITAGQKNGFKVPNPHFVDSLKWAGGMTGNITDFNVYVTDDEWIGYHLAVGQTGARSLA